MKNPTLIVVAGPTASGKTAVAIKLARHFQTEIISVDSRQMYREMNIGTAKPTPEELSQAPHHFINNLSVRDDYNAGKFETDALAKLDEIFSKKEIAIMAGGSGLYIKAVCDGLDALPESDPDLRKQLTDTYEKEGLEPLQKLLAEKDSAYYETADIQNVQRVIRALEVCIISGKPFSSFHEGVARQRSFNLIKIGLDVPREKLYERINQRVEEWLEQGLIEEAKKLYPLREYNALQTVGYQELFDYFSGNITAEKAIELIKRNNRRYAKRQMTWFRKDKDIQWFASDDWPAMLDYISSKT